MPSGAPGGHRGTGRPACGGQAGWHPDPVEEVPGDSESGRQCGTDLSGQCGVARAVLGQRVDPAVNKDPERIDADP